MLGERDRRICNDLYEHKVLTTHQLQDLYFDTPRRTRRRLLKLHQAGVIERFRPTIDKGSAPFHFVLGEVGAYVVASDRGVSVRELKFSRQHFTDLAYSPRLAHLLAVNTFFTRLVWACRTGRDLVVTKWWSEDRTRKDWGRIVLPDALGQIQGSGREATFFLEMDRATESPSRLAKKLDGYHDASLIAEAPKLLLFCFPHEHREVGVRRSLISCGIYTATATFERHFRNPLGPIWLPLGSQDRRTILQLEADRELRDRGAAS